VAHGIVEQVGEQLAEPDRVAGHHRQAPDPQLGPGVGRAGALGDRPDQPAQVDLDRLDPAAPDPGQVDQVVDELLHVRVLSAIRSR
jgi:hypothetical protein